MYSYSVPVRAVEHRTNWRQVLACRHADIRRYWHIYMLVDGERPVYKIAWMLRTPYVQVQKILERMEGIGLVGVQRPASPTVSTPLEKTARAVTGEKQPHMQEEADRAILSNFHAAFPNSPLHFWQRPYHWVCWAACKLPVRTSHG